MIKRMSIFQGVFTKGPASWFILHIFYFAIVVDVLFLLKMIIMVQSFRRIGKLEASDPVTSHLLIVLTSSDHLSDTELN